MACLDELINYVILGGFSMRSYKKLLVSALVSATLCSSTIQAVPTSTLVYSGLGIFGLVGAISTGIVLSSKSKNTVNNIENVIKCDSSPSQISDSDLLKSQKDKAFSEGIARAKEKIIQCIGEDKYNVLYKIGQRAKWNGCKYLEMDPFYLKDVHSVKVVDENKKSVELSGEKLSSFLNSKNEKILGFFLPSGVKAIIDDAFEPIVAGVKAKSCISPLCGKDSYGSGFISTHSENGSYSVFVSKDLELVKICYENYSDKTQCTIIYKAKHKF